MVIIIYYNVIYIIMYTTVQHAPVHPVPSMYACQNYVQRKQTE